MKTPCVEGDATAKIYIIVTVECDKRLIHVNVVKPDSEKQAMEQHADKCEGGTNSAYPDNISKGGTTSTSTHEECTEDCANCERSVIYCYRTYGLKGLQRRGTKLNTAYTQPCHCNGANPTCTTCEGTGYTLNKHMQKLFTNFNRQFAPIDCPHPDIENSEAKHCQNCKHGRASQYNSYVGCCILREPLIEPNDSTRQ